MPSPQNPTKPAEDFCLLIFNYPITKLPNYQILIRQNFSPTQRTILLLFLALTVIAQAQSPSTETGKFRLHKFEQPIGEERYTITRQSETLTLKSDFLFTDRGGRVPLVTTLKAASDYSPQSFDTHGATCRFCPIDWEVQLQGKSAQVRQEKEKRTLTAPDTFFVISGYAPVAMQMAMMRYWRAHGSPAQLAIVPSGEVRIQDRAAENFDLAGHTLALRRYTIRGLIWGMETLWMDGENNLVALVSTDAEFDHFEAVRDEYEPLLPKFIASAARDEMASLTELSAKFAGARTGVLAFVGATVIDGTGRPPIANATVVTSGGRIVAVGPGNQVKVPEDATRIDVSGKYIIPGLWDMHAHYEQVEWGPIYLAAGVTTVRDVGNEFEFITAVRDALNSGHALGPHMLLAGIVDGDGPLALGIQRVNSAADAQTWVQRYHDAGFQQMKIYSSVTPDNVKAICTAAHKLGMTVTGHIPEGMTAYEGVADGMDQINHLHYVYDLLLPKGYDRKKAKPEERWQVLASVDVNSEAGRRAIEFLKKHNTVIDPTMALSEMTFLRPADEPASKIEPGILKVAPELREQLMSGGLPPNLAPLAQKVRQKSLELIGALHRAGVTIVAGTDQAVPGYSVYREIELYVEAGFTPMEALQAASIVPARVMKVESDSGSVETGKRADFDILDANPLDDIHNIRSVRSVVSNGVLYQSAPLWESVGFKP
jgi:imidazolonepropionase-like amidohydrolase